MNKLVLQQALHEKEQRERKGDDVVMFGSSEQALEYMDAWWAKHRMIVEQSELV